MPLIARTATANDFADGATSGMTNMALQLALMATLPSYRMRWAHGPDRLLLVSVGSGVAEHVPPPIGVVVAAGPGSPHERKELGSALSHTSVREDVLCRVLGDVRWATPSVDLESRAPSRPPARPVHFSPTSVQRPPERQGAPTLGRRPRVWRRSASRDRLPRVDALGEVGDAIAAQVDLDHLSGF